MFEKKLNKNKNGLYKAFIFDLKNILKFSFNNLNEIFTKF